MNLKYDLDLIDRTLANDSLSEFVRQAWPILEPGTELGWNWHLDVIAEHLEAVSAGQITRLAISVAPRSGKSLLVSVFWPVWSWVRRPERRFVFASYSAGLSITHSLSRRAILRSQWYQRNWPSIRMADDRDTASEFANTSRGHMIATSVSGTITGKGGDAIVCDDLLNPAQADSEAERNTALRFFDESLANRLDDPKTGAIVVVEQRLNQNDLTAHCLAQGGWTHVNLPAEFESRTTISLPSGREIVKEAGDLLWPERLGRKELDAAKVRLGSYAYQCQYLQAPIAREGNFLKRAWFRRYTSLPEQFEQIAIGLDTAYSEKQTADYSAAVVLGKTKSDFYILDAWRDRVGFPKLKEHVKALIERYSPSLIVVEPKASGLSLIQELRNEVLTPVAEPELKGDKLQRTQAILDLTEFGKVWIPERADWVEDFLDEVCGFPGYKHDDRHDAFVYALHELRKRSDDYRRTCAVFNQGLLGIGVSTTASSLAALKRKIDQLQQIPCAACGEPIGPGSHIEAGDVVYHCSCPAPAVPQKPSKPEGRPSGLDFRRLGSGDPAIDAERLMIQDIASGRAR